MAQAERPGGVVRLDLLRINRNKQKDCQCEEPTFELDVQNRRVECEKCGAILDPFDALLLIAKQHERVEKIHELRMAQLQAAMDRQKSQ